MFIQQLTVKNYRSLKDVHIGDLSRIVVFYGENDSGKSNILSFLHHVFKQKFIREQLLESQAEEGPLKPAGFWRGEIDDFSDNFFKNRPDPIEFTIVIRFDRDEIGSLASLAAFTDQLSIENPNVNLSLVGKIESAGTGKATMNLTEAKLNNKSFYEVKDSEPQYLAEFGLSPSQALDVFTRIMSSLDDAFIRIPTNRFITAEKEISRDDRAELRAATFKNWLFQTSIDREAQDDFRRISEQFAGSPFSHGRISLARVGDNLEVFVEGSEGLKLPLGRKGTGVQQLLMILAYVVVSKSPIVGIEEIEINLSPKSQTSIFNSLNSVIDVRGPIKQIFLTTHSPTIAKREEAACRGVWLDDEGETQVAVRTEAEVRDFFRFPW
jgi:hypothetical protein